MNDGLTYKGSGVDISAADAMVERFKALAASTYGNRVVSAQGAFAGLIKTNPEGTGPMLAASCDGVGTKLLLARDHNRFEGLGQDLVAMNVNDLVVVGARPLLFLDYLAAGNLAGAPLEAIVTGIAEACRQCGCVLLGGETAEMPDLYPQGDFDLAGFSVGTVEAEQVPDPTKAVAGDEVWALPSSGIHANGFSLVRRAIERAKPDLSAKISADGTTLLDALIAPTRLYVNEALELLKSGSVLAAAHITGGGIAGRLAKLLPEEMGLTYDLSAMQRPEVFNQVQRWGEVAESEMRTTFNIGSGFVVVVSKGSAGSRAASKLGFTEVGQVTDRASVAFEGSITP